MKMVCMVIETLLVNKRNTLMLSPLLYMKVTCRLIDMGREDLIDRIKLPDCEVKRHG